MLKRFVSVMFSCFIFTSLYAGGTKEVPEKKEAIIVFAAASTTDVIQDLADIYHEKTGNTVLVNPASSGILAKQLEEGAPADIFISASKKWMDYATDLGLVKESRSFAGNRMVLIAPSDSTYSPVLIDRSLDFPSSFEGRLSVGDPAHVPAGGYAREALEYYDWYKVLESRLLPAVNVRAALSVVELGECDRGIVYRTDALKSDKVKILGVFPEESHNPVFYYCASLTQAGEGGKEFYIFLKSDTTVKVLDKYGFEAIK